MRAHTILAALAMTAAPCAMSAQVSRLAPAFETSITPWAGLSTYGTRQAFASKSASYRASPSLGVGAETSITRRLGIMANVGLSPFAKQRVEQADAVSLEERATLLSADLSLAWRFAARAPVFFYAGGGILAGSLPAYPGFDESVMEPRAVFGVGYDTRSEGSWNIRIVATGNLTFPSTPDPDNWQEPTAVEDAQAKSTVMDWGFRVGARYKLKRAQ